MQNYSWIFKTCFRIGSGTALLEWVCWTHQYVTGCPGSGPFLMDISDQSGFKMGWLKFGSIGPSVIFFCFLLIKFPKAKIGGEIGFWKKEQTWFLVVVVRTKAKYWKFESRVPGWNWKLHQLRTCNFLLHSVPDNFKPFWRLFINCFYIWST